jgi:hypothetical protein
MEARARNLNAAVERGQAVVGNDEAEALVGGHAPDYDALSQAAGALVGLNWVSLLLNGVEPRGEMSKVQAQTAALAIDLVHRAWACGVRWERARSEGGADEETGSGS